MNYLSNISHFKSFSSIWKLQLDFSRNYFWIWRQFPSDRSRAGWRHDSIHACIHTISKGRKGELQGLAVGVRNSRKEAEELCWSVRRSCIKMWNSRHKVAKEVGLVFQTQFFPPEGQCFTEGSGYRTFCNRERSGKWLHNKCIGHSSSRRDFKVIPCIT